MIKLSIRIIVGIVMLFLVANGWWTVALPIAIVAVWFFGNYIEILFLGISYDALFGFAGEGLYSFIGTSVAFVAYISVRLARTLVR